MSTVTKEVKTQTVRAIFAANSRHLQCWMFTHYVTNHILDGMMQEAFYHEVISEILEYRKNHGYIYHKNPIIRFMRYLRRDRNTG